MHPPQFLNGLVPFADRALERIYPVPIPNTDAYQLINAAVLYTLARLAPFYNCTWHSVDGFACYYLGTPATWVQILVIRLSTNAAKISMYPFVPSDPIQGAIWRGANEQAMVADVARVFAYCEWQTQILRREAAEAENYDPPHPKSNDWWDRLDWLDTYHFDKSDPAQAELIHTTVKRLRNVRSDLGRPKLHRIHKKSREFSGT